IALGMTACHPLGRPIEGWQHEVAIPQTSVHSVSYVPRPTSHRGGVAWDDGEADMNSADTTARRRVARLAGLAALVMLLVLGAGFTLVSLRNGASSAEAYAGCRIYVASGDDLPAGHDLNDDSSRYPEKLLADHIQSPGWCLYNQGKNGTTSANFISGGLMSSAY